MGRFRHSRHIQDQSIAADGIYDFDLPVDPLSTILLCLRPLNDTGTLANFARYLEVVGAINRVTVMHRGAAVFSMTGRDAAALNVFRHGQQPMSANENDTNNERRCVVLPIHLGRWAFDTKSCFPATKRGELSLQLDLDIADMGYDDLRLSVETIELPDYKPREYERKTTVSRTMAVGVNDVDLPSGNVIRGILGFGTTGFSGASPAPTLGSMELRADGDAVGFSSTDFEVAMSLGQLLGRSPPRFDAHQHRTTVDGNAQTAVTSISTFGEGSGGWNNYAYLDLDPTRDDEMALNTRGKNSVQLRVTAETADAARFVVVEKVVND